MCEISKECFHLSSVLNSRLEIFEASMRAFFHLVHGDSAIALMFFKGIFITSALNVTKIRWLDVIEHWNNLTLAIMMWSQHQKQFIQAPAGFSISLRKYGNINGCTLNGVEDCIWDSISYSNLIFIEEDAQAVILCEAIVDEAGNSRRQY